MEWIEILVPDAEDIQDELMGGLNDQMPGAGQRMNRKPISLREFGQIAWKLGKGLSIREVSRRTGVCKSTVGRILVFIKGQEEEKTKVKRLSRAIQAHFVTYSLLANPLPTFQRIATASVELGLDMSASTVQRIAGKLSFSTIMVQKKEALTDDHRQYRVIFAMRIRQWLFYRLP